MSHPTSTSLSSLTKEESSSRYGSYAQLLYPVDEEEQPRSAKDSFIALLHKVDSDVLRQAIKHEITRLMSDHERIITVLQQRSEELERQNSELKNMSTEHQRRYEKAVREMQFFRRKYDYATEASKQHSNSHLCRSLSNDSGSSGELVTPVQHSLLGTSLPSQRKFEFSPPPLPPSVPQQQLQSYPLTPTSPQPSTLPADDGDSFTLPIYEPSDYVREKTSTRSRSSSTSVSSSSDVSIGQYWPNPPTAMPIPPSDFAPSTPCLRQHSTATSTHSAPLANTGGSSQMCDSSAPSLGRKSSWHSASLQQHLKLDAEKCTTTVVLSQSQWPLASLPQQPPPPAPVAMHSTPTTGSSPGKSLIHSVPMTPMRSSTATNGYTGASLIQQRRVDPLIFGGSDGLWETIAKSKGSDVTVEKIISNFLRRGGSPNTAKQSASINAVKLGYGMIHALVVTKAPGSLDLLLQQGANPNAMTLSPVEDDKVTPCYLAASVGWLTGLQKLVQAGGDILAARGEGIKNKTALHVAAEHCHAAVVEYIVEITEGALNLERDSNGATVLHYACASGHTDLVSFLTQSCNIPVDQADHRGELPLHWAARQGRLEVVTLLIERCRCDFNAYVPRKVGTPLDIAKLGGHKRLVDYLKGLGGLSAKKMEKKREEEMINDPPKHLESMLAQNGLFTDSSEF